MWERALSANFLPRNKCLDGCCRSVSSLPSQNPTQLIPILHTPSQLILSPRKTRVSSVGEQNNKTESIPRPGIPFEKSTAFPFTPI